MLLLQPGAEARNCDIVVRSDTNVYHSSYSKHDLILPRNYYATETCGEISHTYYLDATVV